MKFIVTSGLVFALSFFSGCSPAISLGEKTAALNYVLGAKKWKQDRQPASYDQCVSDFFKFDKYKKTDATTEVEVTFQIGAALGLQLSNPSAVKTEEDCAKLKAMIQQIVSKGNKDSEFYTYYVSWDNKTGNRVESKKLTK